MRNVSKVVFSSRQPIAAQQEECEHCGNSPDDIVRGERCCSIGNVAGRLSRRAMSRSKSRLDESED